MLNNYDAQLRISSVVPDFNAYVDLYRKLSAEVRSRFRKHLDCPYGPSPLERVDVFLPDSDGTGRPVHVFFHGGYWRAFDKADFSFVARPVVEANAVAVVANYGLMPTVSMADLLAQCRAAIGWVYDNAFRFGGDPHRVSLSGHSAGGHIAALLCLAPWEMSGLPEDVVKSATLVSGIYDLAPVLQSFLKEETGLQQEDVANFSPIAWTERVDRPIGRIALAYGREETEEFKRQSEAFASALRKQNVGIDVLAISKRNHMNVILDLADSNSELGQHQLERILTARTPVGG